MVYTHLLLLESLCESCYSGLDM